MCNIYFCEDSSILKLLLCSYESFCDYLLFCHWMRSTTLLVQTMIHLVCASYESYFSSLVVTWLWSTGIRFDYRTNTLGNYNLSRKTTIHSGIGGGVFFTSLVKNYSAFFLNLFFMYHVVKGTITSHMLLKWNSPFSKFLLYIQKINSPQMENVQCF